MPFVYDFNKVDEIRTVEVNPEGWVSPITIEYGLSQVNPIDTMVSVCWRVKGTTHTFTIYEMRLNDLSKGDYKKHFEEVLEYFRKDYISWFTEKEFEGCEWKNEYQEQFGRFIIQ